MGGQLKAKYDERAAAFADLSAAKQKLFVDYGNQGHMLEEAESKVSALSRAKSSLAAMVEQLKGEVEEGGKGKSSASHALQAARHDLDMMAEQLEEEQEAKEDLQVAFERQTVQLANADKKQRNFDKDFAAQASKYEEVNAELEAAQKSFRDLSADNFKLSQSYDESQDAY